MADLTPENLRRVMGDIDRGPGWYTSAELYRWYVSMCREDDLDAVSQRKFGAALRELGYRNAIRRTATGHARSWFITRRAFRGGAFPGDGVRAQSDTV